LIPWLINVSFAAEPRGMRWTAQAVDQYSRELFWFTVVPIERLREGTDVWAVAERGVPHR